MKFAQLQAAFVGILSEEVHIREIGGSTGSVDALRELLATYSLDGGRLSDHRAQVDSIGSRDPWSRLVVKQSVWCSQMASLMSQLLYPAPEFLDDFE